MSRCIRSALASCGGALGITLFSVLLGLGVNLLREQPVTWWNPPAPRQSTDSGACGTGNQVKANHPHSISQIKARQAWGKPGVAFVDAREELAFRKQRISGALQLPLENLDQKAQRTIERLLEYSVVVVYCDALACACSSQLAEILRTKYALKNVKVLEGGIGDWTKNNYPTQRGAEKSRIQP